MSPWSNLVGLVSLGALFSAAGAAPFLRSTEGHSLAVRAPSTNNTVIIQIFEWSWDSVATECTNFIGPAGYGFVQGLFELL